MMHNTPTAVVGIFESRLQAEEAMRELRDEGFDADYFLIEDTAIGTRVTAFHDGRPEQAEEILRRHGGSAPDDPFATTYGTNLPATPY